MDFFVAWFFIIAFFKGFGMGCIMRLIISILFKTDMSFGGLIRSGFVVGLIYSILTFYMVNQY